METLKYEKLRQVIIEANPEKRPTPCTFASSYRCTCDQNVLGLADILLAYNRSETAHWHGMCVNFHGRFSLEEVPKSATYDLTNDSNGYYGGSMTVLNASDVIDGFIHVQEDIIELKAD